MLRASVRALKVFDLCFFDFAVAEWEAAATTTSKWQQQARGVSGVVLRTPAQVSFLYRAPRHIALNTLVFLPLLPPSHPMFMSIKTQPALPPGLVACDAPSRL